MFTFINKNKNSLSKNQSFFLNILFKTSYIFGPLYTYSLNDSILLVFLFSYSAEEFNAYNSFEYCQRNVMCNENTKNSFFFKL